MEAQFTQRNNVKKISRKRLLMIVAIILSILVSSVCIISGTTQMDIFSNTLSDGLANTQTTYPVGITSIEMMIIGEIQGVITGEELNDSISIVGMHHDLEILYDSETGDAFLVGGREHHPLSILKSFDKSSPKLAQALCSYENLTVLISYYRANTSELRGKQEQYYSITLENATINKIDPYCVQYRESSFGHLEKISFTYSRIKWTYEHLTEGDEYLDDWNSAIICGDANSDEIVNISDVVFIINYLFISSSPIPDPLCIADVNGDDFVNVSDAVYLINYLFLPFSQPPVTDCCP